MALIPQVRAAGRLIFSMTLLEQLQLWMKVLLVRSGIGFISSELLISATNIVNKGMLSAGPDGLLILKGSSVNLRSSGLQITSLAPFGSSNGESNFVADIAIYDQFWRGGTNSLPFTPALWNGTTVGGVSLYNCGATCGASNVTESIGPLSPQVAVSFTNNLYPGILITTNSSGMPDPPKTIFSNIVRQAIFVYISDGGISPSARFGPSIGVSNIFRPTSVRLLTTSQNIVTGSAQSSAIYVVDDLAAVGTNGNLIKNTYLNPGGGCLAPTYRPDSVAVSRADDGTYFSGTAGNNGRPTNTFFFLPNFPTCVAFGQADAYSVLVDNLSAEPPAGYTITNAPGRVEIYAKDLNLNKTRISASAGIVVSASNLVSSAGAVLDCQNLSFNLGSTNGLLNVTNLATQAINRFSGTVSEWSGFWTNYEVDIYTNYIQDTSTSNWVQSNITNLVQVNLAITVVDASGLGTVLPVTTFDMLLHSTNMIISDAVTVQHKLLFDGQYLTINGGVTLTDPLVTWNSATAPTLRYFTNNGVVQIPEEANFGNDGATNYAVFVNNGTIIAGTESVNSDLYLESGYEGITSGFYVTTGSGRVENAYISSQQDVRFNAGTLKLSNSQITANNQLYFAVTSSLFDSGSSSANYLTCYNGFNLASKPATGDLLGTQVQTVTPTFGSVDHYWSALDLGASPAGYSNNVAVGQLILVEGLASEFNFNGTGVSNAIYVDLLDLSLCPDFLDPDVLTSNPNFVIYYAAVTLPSSFTVPPNSDGIAQQPEEYLNGQLGGHLRWVSGFAGANSSVDVVINGKTAQVNKALRFSKIIDSNGNGIPNYYDLNPFDPPPVILSGSVVTNNPPPAMKFAISWTAYPNTSYQVQYSTNLSPPTAWTLLQNYTNSTSSNVVVTVWDTNVLSSRRFYRVSHP